MLIQGFILFMVGMLAHTAGRYLDWYKTDDKRLQKGVTGGVKSLQALWQWQYWKEYFLECAQYSCALLYHIKSCVYLVNL